MIERLYNVWCARRYMRVQNKGRKKFLKQMRNGQIKFPPPIKRPSYYDEVRSISKDD